MVTWGKPSLPTVPHLSSLFLLARAVSHDGHMRLSVSPNMGTRGNHATFALNVIVSLRHPPLRQRRISAADQ